jgi:hypothetical protein
MDVSFQFSRSNSNGAWDWHLGDPLSSEQRNLLSMEIVKAMKSDRLEWKSDYELTITNAMPCDPKKTIETLLAKLGAKEVVFSIKIIQWTKEELENLDSIFLVEKVR